MNDPLTFDLSQALHAGQRMMTALGTMGDEVFVPCACTGMTLALVKSALTISGGRTAETFVRTVACFGAFEMYETLFRRTVDAVGESVAFLEKESGLRKLLSIAATSAADIAVNSPHFYSAVIPLWKGAAQIMSSVPGLGALNFSLLLIVWVTKVALCILYCIGPVMIAVGAIGGQGPIASWFKMTSQVLLWPIFANFLGVTYVYVGGDVAMASGALMTSITCTWILAILVFLTPLSVWLLMSHGGVGAVAGFIGGAALKMAGNGLSAGLSMVGGPAGGAFSRSILHGVAHSAKAAFSSQGAPRPDSSYQGFASSQRQVPKGRPGGAS